MLTGLPPIARLVLGLCAGMAVGLRFPATGLLVAAAALAAPILLLLLRARSASMLPVAAAAVGWALAGAAVRQGAADCRNLLPDGAEVAVRGAFAARAWPDASAPFAADELRAEGRPPCAGEVRAKVRPGTDAPAAGVPLIGRGKWWAQPAPGRWPRPPERAGTLTLDSLVPARTLPRPAGAPAPARPAHPLLRARDRAQALVRDLFGRRAPLAESLVLAQEAGLDQETRDNFAASGLSHLLSISGLHVGLVAAAILLLARALRLPAQGSAIGAAVATGAYVLFLGAPVPALRSGVQLALVLFSRLLQRPADARGLVAACALAVLLLTPMALLDAGFQLSFGGVLGILLLRPRLLPWMAWLRARWLRESVATSVAATLATTPIAVAQFGRVAPIGILANLLAIPIAGLAVPAIAVVMAVAAAAPAFGHFLAGGASLLLGALDAIARAAAAVPGGHAVVPADNALAWTLATSAAAAVAAAAPPPARMPAPAPPGPAGRARARVARAGPAAARRRRYLMAAGTGAALLLLWPVALRVAGAGRVEIWAIDVGQGDAIAIRTPAGRWLLVDAGPRDARFDAGRARVVPFLLGHGARRLEALVLTHPDADHIGGAMAVLQALPVGEVIEPARPAGKALYLGTLRAARARGARWTAAREGRELRMDGMVLRFLAPRTAALDAGAGDNEVSVVFSLEYAGFRALFMGDAPTTTEDGLVADEAGALPADVIKLGHHGSTTSSGPAFLDAVHPRVALISVGRHNRFGHPAPAVLRALGRRGIRVYRTDLQGTLEVVAGPGGWSVETAR